MLLWEEKKMWVAAVTILGHFHNKMKGEHKSRVWGSIHSQKFKLCLCGTSSVTCWLQSPYFHISHCYLHARKGNWNSWRWLTSNRGWSYCTNWWFRFRAGRHTSLKVTKDYPRIYNLAVKKILIWKCMLVYKPCIHLVFKPQCSYWNCIIKSDFFSDIVNFQKIIFHLQFR